MSTQVPSTQQQQFANILKPLRQLADNWDIDLTHELDEFVGGFSQLTQAFTQLTQHDAAADEHGPSFTQAALFIQSSANIYSKKVEYLSQLTAETHAYVFGRGRLRMLPAEDSEVADHDGERRPRGDKKRRALDQALEEFKSLDDLYPEIENKPRDREREKQPPLMYLPRVMWWSPPHSTASAGGQEQELLDITGESLGKRSEFAVNQFSQRGGWWMSKRVPKDVVRIGGRRSSVASVASASSVHELADATTAAADVGMNDDLDDDIPAAMPSSSPMKQQSFIDHDHYEDPALVVVKPRPSVNPPKAPRNGKDFWVPLDPHSSLAVGKPFKKAKLSKKFKAMDQLVKSREFEWTDHQEIEKRWQMPSCVEFVKVVEHRAKSAGESDKRRQMVQQIIKRQVEEVVHEVMELPEDVSFNDVVDVDDGDDDEVSAPLTTIVDDQPIQSFEQSTSIQDYLLRAEQFQSRHESAIVKSVRGWEQKVQPLLELQRQRGEFDVKTYQRRVLNAMRDKESFTALIEREHLPSFESARWFLSCLFLANEKRLSITRPSPDDCGMSISTL